MMVTTWGSSGLCSMDEMLIDGVEFWECKEKRVVEEAKVKGETRPTAQRGSAR
jgi:hypothetical protein